MSARSRRSPVPPSIELPPAWRRYGLRLLIGATLALSILCARASRTPPPDDDAARYHDRVFRVARVVDGDTVDIDAPDGDKSVTRIRLWGVDTPEMARGKKPVMYFANEATTFARRTLDGRDVHLVLSQRRTRGKYGRLLAYVFLERGGSMFNEMLLEEGYAYADRRFGHHYKDRFERIEKRARRAGVGLWGSVTIERMPEWRQRFERSSGQATSSGD